MAKCFLSPISCLHIVLFCLLHGTWSNEISGPIFIKEPKSNADFLNTEGILLDCSAHGIPDPEISWLRKNGLDDLQLVESMPPFLNFYANGSLAIHRFTEDQYRQDIHATVYKCMASNIHGSIISYPVSVKATTKQQQQQLQAQVYDEYVIPGNTAVLTCHIPPFYKRDLEIISWIREDNLIVKANSPKNGLKMTEDGKLLIESVESSTNVELGYWCQIKNKLTADTFLSQSAGQIKLTEHQGGVPPSISYISETVVAQLGEPVENICVGQGYPPPTYRWKSVSSGKIVSKLSTLSIPSFSEAGTYTYSCIAQNKFGIDERKSTLIVKEPLEVYIRPNVQTVNSGDEFKLECVINGHPVEEVLWKFNGKSLKESEKINNSKTKITIVSASREHEGMYQCMVKNSWENVQTAAQIRLGDIAPAFIQKFKSKKLQPGPSIALKCIATGRPTPRISWILNGQTVSPDNKFILRESRSKNGSAISSLIVKNIRSIDGGDYSCVATNKVDSIQFSRSIKVYGPPLVHRMKNITAAVGQDVNIKCYVSGYPVSAIQWIKDSTDFYDHSEERIVNKKNLEILKISEDDEGYYTCKAESGRSLISEEKIFINVIKKPKLAPLAPPPSVLEAPSPYSTFCSIISGDHPIKLYWMKDNIDASLISKVDVTNTKTYSLLQIHEVDASHSGNYTCVAENEAGTTRQSIYVRISSPPKWIIQPETLKVRLHSEAIFNCLGEAFPKPVTKWYRHDNKSNIVEIKPFDIENFEILQNGTLKISTNKNTQGKYSCVVSNGIKPKLVKVVTVEIIDPLKILLEQLKKDLNDTTLQCTVNGSNNIKIQWINSQGKITSQSKRFTITEKKSSMQHGSILKVHNLSKTDIFKCTASSGNDFVERTIILKQKDIKQVDDITLLKSKVTEKVTTKYTATKPTVNSKLQKNSKIIEKIERQGDATFIGNGPKRGLESEIVSSSKDDSYDLMDSHESRSQNSKMDIKTLLLFVLPAVAVFVLLILLIITLIAYLVTKNSNQRMAENNKIEYSGIDTLNRSGSRTKENRNIQSLDSRYGKLERPLPIPDENNDENYQNPYEIPDYYAGMKSYSTLQYPNRPQSQTNSMPRTSQASL